MTDQFILSNMVNIINNNQSLRHPHLKNKPINQSVEKPSWIKVRYKNSPGYNQTLDIIKKNKPGGINYLGKVVEKYMKKYPFSHGRSKIGLFLVIHGNNHTLLIVKKKSLFFP